MHSARVSEASLSWWYMIAPRANRVYFAGLIAASLLVFLLPHVLGRIIPCAEYMEADWLMVALLSMTAVGALNVTFAFMPWVEGYLPGRLVTPLRTFLVIVLPCIAVIAIVWLAVGAFIPALADERELLCD